MSDPGRSAIYQTYTRESIAVIHQQREREREGKRERERERERERNLAPRKSDGNQNAEWTTISHILLPNYFLDLIDLLRQNRERMYESCTIKESYPALEKTTQPRSTILPEEISSRMAASQSRCMKIRRDVIVLMQSANRVGIFRQ